MLARSQRGEGLSRRYNSRLPNQIVTRQFVAIGHSDQRLIMLVAKTLALFIVTALAEIIGCFLPYLWLRKGGSAWLLVPAALSLALFAWLLSLHPAAAGRVYAAYGGVYIAVALIWLWKVDGIAPTVWDLTGASVAVIGMLIIVWGGWKA